MLEAASLDVTGGGGSCLTVEWLSVISSSPSIHNALPRRRPHRKGREEGLLLGRVVRQLILKVGRSSRPLQPGQSAIHTNPATGG